MIISKGLIVRLEAKPGKEEAAAAFLRGALPLVEDEPKTVAWFGFQNGPSSFAIVDVFPDEERRAHLIETVDALAAKLP